MTKIAATIYSKFSFFSRKRQSKHIPVPNDDVEDTEDFRTRGSEILKALSIASESITTRSPTMRRIRSEHDFTCFNNSDKTVTDLHKTGKKSKFQQQQQRQQRMEDFKENMSSSENEWQNKVKRLKCLKRTIELARRKRLDNKGSFPVNMVTYRDHKNKTISNINEKGYKGKDNMICCLAATSSSRVPGHDDRSRSSESTCVSNDFTLQVIDEEIANYNT
jgi:hypothetical protein